MIRINRSPEFRDKVRSYKVIVDDEFIGELKSGETKNFEVSEGEHTIYLKIDWCKSNKLDFKATANELCEFDCGNSMKSWRVFFSLIYISFLKNQYLWLKVKNGKV